MRKQRKRRHRARNLLLFLLIVVGVWFIGTYTLKTTDVHIKSDKIQNEITIVQLTDLHGATFGEDNEFLIENIKDINPDFIVATGDMYTSSDEEGRKTAKKLLTTLAKNFDVYSVNGEHDNDDEYKKELKDGGVEVLDYEYRDITVGASTVRLYGINNVYYSDTFDLANEFDINTDMYNILAAHISNFGAFYNFGVDLSMCGDSHGGQIRLPHYGGLINRNVWLPETKIGDVRYVKGLYGMGKSKLFVSSGLGNYPFPIRFLNRPEIAVIHLSNS